MSLSGRISHFIDNNPMKVYAGIFMSGDALLSLNVLTTASYLWLVGIASGFLAHGLKLVYGRGAVPRLQADDYKIGLRSSFNTLKECVSFSSGVLKPSFWRDTFNALAAVKPEGLKQKFRQVADFKNYPLDAGWALITGSGVTYALDASNVLSLRDEASVLQAATGGLVAAGASMALATDRNDICGRFLSMAVMTTLAAGIYERNPPLVLASIAFLYGANLVSKVDSRYQSDHTANLQRPENPAP